MSKRSLSPEDSVDGTPQGRQRSRAACQPCRSRKRKCDGRLPCATCVRYEYTCEYASTTKRASHHHNHDANEADPPAGPIGHTSPSIISLQKHPLTAPGARFHHRSILDPIKTRFVRANSAIAFPRILGMDMEAESIPRLHSFAWHLGTRPESVEPHTDVTSLITWDDLCRFTRVYFDVVKVELGLLDEPDFMEQAAARYKAPAGINDVDAVILGVAVLGSFFASIPHPNEAEMVAVAKHLLMSRSIAHSPSPPHVAAWILRTIYLRLTARPHGAWMTSCLLMHQIEAAGIHKEMQTIAVVYPAVPADNKLARSRRKMFHIARALNTILSFEYGRMRVHFDIITTKKFASTQNEFAHQFVELADILPSDFVDRDREPDPPAALGNALTKIENMQTDSAFISMLKADLAFAIYRRLWLMSLTDAKDRADTVIALGKGALSASAILLERRHPWHNVIHGPFQFLCVLIAVNTPKSLAVIPEIMALMLQITKVYDNHVTREAYSQCTALIAMTKRRKEKELEALNAIPDGPAFSDHPSIGTSSTFSDAPNLDWMQELDQFGWEMFLNPELVISSQQAQLGLPATVNGQV